MQQLDFIDELTSQSILDIEESLYNDFNQYVKYEEELQIPMKNLP